MNEAIYKNIKSLPPLDDTVVQIQRVCQDENSNLSDLVAIVERDPMLTANILHSANSPLYGFSREISTIQQAVNLFGMATIRGFALYGAVKKSFNIDLSPYRIRTSDFLSVVTSQNILAFNWYGKVDRSMLVVLAPTSFMMEVGKIVIAKELLETGKVEEFKSGLEKISTPSELSDLERSILDVTNEEVTAKIFEQWNLESEMVDSIYFSNTPDDAPEHIKPCATALKIIKNAINVFGVLTEENINRTLVLLDTYGFEQGKFMEAVQKVKG